MQKSQKISNFRKEILALKTTLNALKFVTPDMQKK